MFKRSSSYQQETEWGGNIKISPKELKGDHFLTVNSILCKLQLNDIGNHHLVT